MGIVWSEKKQEVTGNKKRGKKKEENKVISMKQ